MTDHTYETCYCGLRKPSSPEIRTKSMDLEIIPLEIKSLIESKALKVHILSLWIGRTRRGAHCT